MQPDQAILDVVWFRFIVSEKGGGGRLWLDAKKKMVGILTPDIIIKVGVEHIWFVFW